MYASATGIARRARRRLEKDSSDTVLRTIKEPAAKAVFDAVKEGDAVAIEIDDMVYEDNTLELSKDCESESIANLSKNDSLDVNQLFFCFHCGNKLVGNANFCSKCGTKVK